MDPEVLRGHLQLLRRFLKSGVPVGVRPKKRLCEGIAAVTLQDTLPIMRNSHAASKS